MSGGSYDYLCFKDTDDLFNFRHQLHNMRDRLTDMGYMDAAKETESILLILDQVEVRLQARLDRLSPIWHAVEWYDSNDWGKESVEEAIKKYREE